MEKKNWAHLRRQHIRTAKRKALPSPSLLLIVSLHTTGMTRSGYIFGGVPTCFSQIFYVFDNLELAWGWKVARTVSEKHHELPWLCSFHLGQDSDDASHDLGQGNGNLVETAGAYP